MNNKLMAMAVALLILALLAPTGIFAFERPASCLVDNARTREIRANEPKTPEELLRVLKGFMENPQMSGYDIGEKITGIARENWGKPYRIKGVQSFPHIRKEMEALPPGGHYPAGGGAPYRLKGNIIELDKDGTLRDIWLGDFKKGFCLKPALARKILGEPSYITLGDKGSLRLVYNIPSDRKRQSIVFICIPRHAKKLDRITGTIREKDKFSKVFEERRNTCALTVSIRSNMVENCLVDSPRTRAIRANEPKTPEELLRVLKVFMENPQMSGFDIVEKITGIARENWGEPQGTKGVQYFPYIRGGLKAPPPGKRYPFTGGGVRSTTPYYLVDDGIIELDKDSKLRSISLGGFKDGFCLTPVLARKILGEPSSVELGSKGSLLLVYNTASEQRRYAIRIYCTRKQETKGLDRPAGTFTDKNEFPKIFEERKNTCADGVSISSTK